jgi:hypothetical protein
MEEKRKEQRLNHENEIVVTLVDDEETPVQGKSLNNHSLDISVTGVKIKSNIPLPVDTLSRIKIKLQKFGKMITTIKGKSLNNHSLDISMSGVKIKSDIPLPVDTLIRIKIKLQKFGKMITTIGKVKWTNGLSMNKFYEAGVEFVEISYESILLLEEYITSRQSILVLEEYISQGVDRHGFNDKF